MHVVYLFNMDRNIYVFRILVPTYGSVCFSPPLSPITLPGYCKKCNVTWYNI